MTEDQALQQIETAAYLAALCGGSEAFFYWGDDKETVRFRAADMRIVLIGANLDTEVIWLNPKAFREAYGRLRNDVEREHIHFVGEG